MVHGLAHTGAAEQAHLAALGERAHQVDHLDAGLQELGRGRSSSNAGASRWIDIGLSASTGPASSIGRPSTSMMRPSVAGPTGTDDRRAGILRPSCRAAVRRTSRGRWCARRRRRAAAATSSVQAGAFRASARHRSSGRCSRENSTSIDRADALDDGSFVHDAVPSIHVPIADFECVVQTARRACRRSRKVPW